MKVLVADKISPKGVAYLREQPGIELLVQQRRQPAIEQRTERGEQRDDQQQSRSTDSPAKGDHLLLRNP